MEKDQTALTKWFLFHNSIDFAKYLFGQKYFTQEMVYSTLKG